MAKPVTRALTLLGQYLLTLGLLLSISTITAYLQLPKAGQYLLAGAILGAALTRIHRISLPRFPSLQEWLWILVALAVFSVVMTLWMTMLYPFEKTTLLNEINHWRHWSAWEPGVLSLLGLLSGWFLTASLVVYVSRRHARRSIDAK